MRPEPYPPTLRLADFAAVLFDLDGTLLDTEPLWHQAEIDLFAEYGVPWSVEQALELTGLNMPSVAEFMRSKGVELAPQQIIDRLAGLVLAGLRKEVVVHERVVALLARCRAEGKPTALVTMSPRAIADAAIAALPPDSFTITLAAEDVVRGKPDPEPYLKAAAALGVPAADCLVIEDSRFGIASALAAGCTVRSVGPLAGSVAGAPAL